MQSKLNETADTIRMNVAKDLGQSRGFDIHESKCGNGAGLDFKCLPLLLLSAVGDRDLSAVHIE